MASPSRITRLRVLALIEIITLVLIIALQVYEVSSISTADSQAETETDLSVLSKLLYWLGGIGLVSEFTGLIGIYKEQNWAKVVFSISIGIGVLTITFGNSEMGGSGIRFLRVLNLVYWLVAGAIIALSFEKPTFDKVT